MDGCLRERFLLMNAWPYLTYLFSEILYGTSLKASGLILPHPYLRHCISMFPFLSSSLLLSELQTLEETE